MTPKVSQLTKYRVLNYLLNQSASGPHVMLSFMQVDAARKHFKALPFDVAVESLESEGLLERRRYADGGYAIKLTGRSFDFFSKRRAAFLFWLFGFATGIATPFVSDLIASMLK